MSSAVALTLGASAFAAGVAKPGEAPAKGQDAVKESSLPQATDEVAATPRGKPLSPDRSSERQPDQRLGRKGGADEVPKIADVDVSGKPSGPQGDSWQSIMQLPDLGGGWTTHGPFRYGIRGHAPVPVKPPFDIKLAEVRALSDVDGEITTTTSKCLPNGMPMIMTSTQGLLEFLLTPGRLTITSEDGELRRIWTDGRKQDADPDLTFEGHSVGHWENGVLYVDTVGMDPHNQVFYGFVGGGPMHVKEKMRLTDSDTITVDTTIEDPATFTRPWSYPTNYYRTKNSPKESLCVQNNISGAGAAGGSGFPAPPPK
jgi:hypothetical protein